MSFGVVHRPEDQGVHPLAGDGRRIGIDDAFGRLNEELDGDAAHLQAPPPLQFLQLPVEPLHIVRAAAFGQADAGKTLVDNGFEVIVGHQGLPVVDPDVDGGAARSGVLQVLPDNLPGLGLLGRGDGVLQVQGDDIGRVARSLRIQTFHCFPERKIQISLQAFCYLLWGLN